MSEVQTDTRVKRYREHVINENSLKEKIKQSKTSFEIRTYWTDTLENRNKENVYE